MEGGRFPPKLAANLPQRRGGLRLEDDEFVTYIIYLSFLVGAPWQVLVSVFLQVEMYVGNL